MSASVEVILSEGVEVCDILTIVKEEQMTT